MYTAGKQPIAEEEILYYENFNTTDVVSPVDYAKLEELLKLSKYDESETEFLVDGFKNGFSLGYEGPEDVKITAPNLKFRGIGNNTTLWNKVMKEVKLGRYAGPFNEIPFENYIQSLIGLVPKDGGKATRLIFHLSYPRNCGKSVNENTPAEYCSVHYPDFSKAVQLCAQAGISCKIAQSDMQSAFRHLGILRKHWKYLVMMAKSPIDGKNYYFFDKALPFGSSISCSHFQRFSNAVAHIVKFLSDNAENVNYLDDFLFVALLQYLCNNQVRTFLEVCEQIKFPVAMEKTFWGTTRLVFLGLLIDTISQTVSVPIDKIVKAIDMVQNVLNNDSKKITLNQLQKICGFLNFLGRCVVPGRAFTRRLYAFSLGNLKPHHHIKINQEMRRDLETWLVFLKHPSIFNRPFLDFSKLLIASEINLYSDASGRIGFGAICDSFWMYGYWPAEFLDEQKPSIEFLELFGVVVAVVQWIHKYKNKRIVLFCDNKSVVDMVNLTSSGCKRCMVLIRILVLKCMVENIRVYCKHVRGIDNKISDALSRGRIAHFKRKYGAIYQEKPDEIPEEMWPISKVWMN